MIYFWATLCALACGLTLWSQSKQRAWWAGLFKTLASISFFVPACIYLISHQQQTWSVLMVAAFGFSLLGDVLLIKTTNKRFFLLGLAAFLLAHLFYAGAFAWAGLRYPEAITTSVVVIAAMIGCYVWLYRHLTGTMKVAVPAYLTAIGLMLIAAMLTRHHAHQLIVAGAVLFALSDVFVARQRFVSPGFNNRLIGLPLYYAGQLVLLAALLSSSGT
ncbi:lysoplasmalogenase [Marinicella gelatinilytica]|uniref:lysoplasmalogenase n=1 Tax=Marinicella gelatinilytica TaxID=2996017 RepID=UPI002260FC6B|nr:lysoplasmalogenase [Marinicella gelatinilytica]MCX7544382.1 lysoplasmalogenase [Marinicella gelatinilytica]